MREEVEHQALVGTVRPWGRDRGHTHYFRVRACVPA
jgi:hypothetical protein